MNNKNKVRKQTRLNKLQCTLQSKQTETFPQVNLVCHVRQNQPIDAWSFNFYNSPAYFTETSTLFLVQIKYATSLYVLYGGCFTLALTYYGFVNFKAVCPMPDIILLCIKAAWGRQPVARNQFLRLASNFSFNWNWGWLIAWKNVKGAETLCWFLLE